MESIHRGHPFENRGGDRYFATACGIGKADLCGYNVGTSNIVSHVIGQDTSAGRRKPYGAGSGIINDGVYIMHTECVKINEIPNLFHQLMRRFVCQYLCAKQTLAGSHRTPRVSASCRPCFS